MPSFVQSILQAKKELMDESEDSMLLESDRENFDPN